MLSKQTALRLQKRRRKRTSSLTTLKTLMMVPMVTTTLSTMISMRMTPKMSYRVRTTTSTWRLTSSGEKKTLMKAVLVLVASL